MKWSSRGVKGIVATLLVAGCIGASANLLFPTPRFPVPTGQYAIGTRVYNWIDASRPEPFTTDGRDRRRLVAQIWYPATVSSPPAPYLDNATVAKAIANRFGLPGWLSRNLQKAPTHASIDAPAVQSRFPVLVNPTGFSGFRGASLFWIEELVSRGYIVIGLDQPGTALMTVFPDGTTIAAMSDRDAFDRLMPLALSRAPDHVPQLNGAVLPGGIVPFLARDLSFVLDRLVAVDESDPILKGRIDVARAGVFGMSLGGYVATEACRQDARFLACLAVDSGHTPFVAAQGLAQPVLVMTRDADIMREERRHAGGWPEDEIAHTISSQRSLFENNRGDSYFVTMNEMYHLNWTDAPLWSPIIRWAKAAGPLDPYRGFAMTNECTVSFFDFYLKRNSAAVTCPQSVDSAVSRFEKRIRSGFGSLETR